MNLFKTVFRIVFIAFITWSCSGNKSHEEHADGGHEHHDAKAEADAAVWKEMDEFHEVMAKAFHPYMDNKDLAPAKQHGEELAKLAHAWVDAPLPADINPDAMKGKIMKLDEDAQALQSAIQAKAADDVIVTKLTALHDSFHVIQDAWYEREE